jgi:hypothetical protein
MERYPRIERVVTATRGGGGGPPRSTAFERDVQALVDEFEDTLRRNDERERT